MQNKDAQDPIGQRARLAAELIGIVVPLGLFVYALAISWRKWPDPIFDVGVELDAARRLAGGGVLYRDALSNYGPLPAYFDALVFRLFGPGLMVYVAENLVVFIAIAAVIYFLFRRAWGIPAAFASTGLFVLVFGFAQHATTGNYNYATPYSQATTHGVLVCLLLILALMRWIERRTPASAAVAGFPLGLTFLIKPEFILPGVACIVLALISAARHGKRPLGLEVASIAGGAIVSNLIALAFFACQLSLGQAVLATSHAWLAPILDHRYLDNFGQQKFLGIDRPWQNIVSEITATLLALALFGVIALVMWASERIQSCALQNLVRGGLVVAVAYCAATQINWIESGSCLVGLTLLYLGWSAYRLFARKDDLEPQRALLRLLLAATALCLLARMVLNPRIYHLGYYQAVIAAIIVPAVFLGELPQFLRIKQSGTCWLVAGTFALFLPGAAILTMQSQRIFDLKTMPVGEGVDRFYAFAPSFEPTGSIVEDVRRHLVPMASGHTLLVLPHGHMLNYLLRMPGPTQPGGYYGPEADEAVEVQRLQAHPPDYVVLISYDLRDYGIARYGEKDNAGRQTLDWVRANYHEEQHYGGDPLDVDQRGAIIFARNSR